MTSLSEESSECSQIEVWVVRDGESSDSLHATFFLTLHDCLWLKIWKNRIVLAPQ